MLYFSDGTTCMLYELNFFFCLGSLWTTEQLYKRAAEAIAAQHQTLERGGII